MTLQEALQEGLLVAATGLIIVFSVLIILMLTMMAMKKIFNKDDSNKNDGKPVSAEVASAPATASGDNANIIAVIAAAVAAFLNTSVHNLKVRSIKRIGNNAPDWNKAGLKETIDSRF